MNQLEYYIRQPSDTESRGPFTFDQLNGLARSGGVNGKTLYFDATTDNWLSMAETPALASILRGAKSPHQTASTAPTIASKLLGALLFASGLALLLPALSGSASLDSNTLLSHPYIWLGVLDILLALCCLAFGARFFLIIRIRAGLGIGFLGVLFWLQSNTGALIASLVAAVCLWLATTLSSRSGLTGNAIAGLAAFAALAYCLLP